MELSDIAKLLDQQNEDFASFRQKQEDRIAAVESTVLDATKQANRRALFGSRANDAPKLSEVEQPSDEWIDTKSRQRVAVLKASESLAAIETKADIKTPSIGRVLRGIVMGGQAPDARELEEERKALSIGTDTSGGYTVTGALSSQWIDQLRAASVLNRAGIRTTPMDGNSLTLAKVTGDPTVSWHGENAPLVDSDATFGAVSLHAKTVACLIKLSLELAQDSANIEEMLTRTINAAMARAIDDAGLNGVALNANAVPMSGAGVLNLTGRKSVTGIGAPANWDFLVDAMYELAALNTPLDSIGAFVAHPAVWKRMRKLKTGLAGDNTPLTMPEEVTRLPKLWTTAAPLTGGTTAKGVIGNWSDLLLGVRKNITVKVLQETFMASNLQIAILAYARLDFAATRPTSFCTLEGITV